MLASTSSLSASSSERRKSTLPSFGRASSSPAFALMTPGFESMSHPSSPRSGSSSCNVNRWRTPSLSLPACRVPPRTLPAHCSKAAFDCSAIVDFAPLPPLVELVHVVHVVVCRVLVVLRELAVAVFDDRHFLVFFAQAPQTNMGLVVGLWVWAGACARFCAHIFGNAQRKPKGEWRLLRFSCNRHRVQMPGRSCPPTSRRRATGPSLRTK